MLQFKYRYISVNHKVVSEGREIKKVLIKALICHIFYLLTLRFLSNWMISTQVKLSQYVENV